LEASGGGEVSTTSTARKLCVATKARKRLPRSKEPSRKAEVREWCIFLTDRITGRQKF
jgi:hypothetical protein